jgi:hypothetical protein
MDFGDVNAVSGPTQKNTRKKTKKKKKRKKKRKERRRPIWAYRIESPTKFQGG